MSYIWITISIILITYAWIFFSRKKGNLVELNHRSSHKTPTPQGGGISIALVTIFTAILSYKTIEVDVYLLAALISSVTIGFIDDQYGLKASYKAVFISFVAILLIINALPNDIDVLFFTEPVAMPSILFLPIIFLGVVWIINLTNFVDGINGIITIEAIFIIGLTLIYYDLLKLNISNQQIFKYLLLSSIIFLPFNFPKAFVFLGDVGSLFFGSIFAYVFLIYITSDSSGIWVFLIIFSVCWVDATYTLLTRLIKKENPFKAHKSHAYQHAANNYFKSHTKTVLLIVLINLCWLFPMSYIAISMPYPVVTFIIAIVPIIYYCYYFRAGKLNH